MAPFTFALIAGGRSNLTFAVTGADGRRFVLRRPPLGHVLATAHDMAHETPHHRRRRHDRTCPCRRRCGLCTDESVNGAPFYVMGFVDGVVLDSPEKAALLPLELRRPASEHLIDVLADLHVVDVDEVGLGDLAKREGYVERQVKRWSTQWANSKTRELPAIDEVARRAWRRAMPEQHGVVDRPRRLPVRQLPHRRRARPHRRGARLGAVHARRPARRRRLPRRVLDRPGLGAAAAQRPDRRVGFPTYDDCSSGTPLRTGRDVSGIDYYVAFSSWRLAVISEGVYARYLHGAMGDQVDAEVIETFKVGTEQLAEAALDGDQPGRSLTSVVPRPFIPR